MALIGNIEPFSGKAEEFEAYMERIDHLFMVNVVEEAMEVSMFVTLAGSQVYQTLRNLAAPRKPSELTYTEVKELLKKHYAPTVSEIYERYVFNTCLQKPDQSISDYIVELKKLASTCNFGDFLDNALRDRFVCGIRSESVQRRLLSETVLKFPEACNIALAAELAEKQVKSLGEGSAADITSVDYVSGTRVIRRYSGQDQQRSSGTKEQQHKQRCGRCNRYHEKGKCPAWKWRCFGCQQLGHAKQCCPKQNVVNGGREQVLENTLTREEVMDAEENGQMLSVKSDLFSLNNLREGAVPPKKVLLKLNEKYCYFEVDTGACKSVMSSTRFKNLFNGKLRPVCYQLNVISGHSIRTLGECEVDVVYSSLKAKVPLTIIECSKEFVPLMGRDWLNVFFPDWERFFGVNNVVQSVVNESVSMQISKWKQLFSRVFDCDLCSPIEGYEVRLSVKENVGPVFKKAYSMPFSLRPKVEKKLNEMVSVGILKRVSHSDWASPIVVVPKKTGDVRICTDFRTTVNTAINVDQYPLPIPEDIFAGLAGGKVFTVLDLSGAYQQLKVHPEFCKYLTINTHMGLFQYTRLTYGLASAPAIFQCFMERILSGIEGVFCYIDDILIVGSTVSRLNNTTQMVFKRLNGYNVKINVDKCRFCVKSVDYLGHNIDSSGIRPTTEKVRAIQEAPEPINVSQIRAYLGLINYYSKFVPMLSSALKPLHRLLEKGVEFEFGKGCREAFEKSKRLIIDNRILVHYDPSKPIVISCDASSYGVGGVLSHRVNGVEKPVMYVSSSLSKTEQNYSQLEREALAIIFCVRKFHKYIYGREFVLVSDHKPLKFIFDPKRNISIMSASRIIRWNIILSTYKYTVEYKKGSELYEADMLSRLPLSDATGVENSVNMFSLSEELPLTYEDIALVTNKDKVLGRVGEYVKTGWKCKIDNDVKPYYLRRNELSVEEGCVMLGTKVIVPEALRPCVLALLHESHVGIVRTKILARSVIWWPGLQMDIESTINKCEVCQTAQNNAEKYLVSWPRSENVFQRIHVDFFFWRGTTFLLIVDTKSKWLDIHCMGHGTSVLKTIEKLKLTFSILGLPQVLVSDNGPPFNSLDFKQFCNVNGITLLKSPPYHPQSNGAAERHVQTVKSTLKKFLLQKSTLTLEQQVVNFLFSYRNTPCASTGQSPNEVIFKIKPRTRLDLLKPGQGERTIARWSARHCLDKGSNFKEGETVLVGHLGPYVQEKWKKGTVIKRVSPVTYVVQVEGKEMFKHVNSLRKWDCERSAVQTSGIPITNRGVGRDSGSVASPVWVHQEGLREGDPRANCASERAKDVIHFDEAVANDPRLDTAQGINRSPEVALRRSTRIRKAPKRLDL